jgi:predicted CoA-binding protein
MPSPTVIDRFLAQQHIAVVGVSRDPKQFANVIYRRLRDGGRTMYPVNHNLESATIEGDRCYHLLADVPDPVDGVIVVVPPDAVDEVVNDAIARGIPRVWFHKGFGPASMTDAAVARCREHCIEVVDGACPLMFDEPIGGFHRVHRLFARHRFEDEALRVT